VIVIGVVLVCVGIAVFGFLSRRRERLFYATSRVPERVVHSRAAGAAQRGGGGGGAPPRVSMAQHQ
jgi:hypothetical protein